MAKKTLLTEEDKKKEKEMEEKLASLENPDETETDGDESEGDDDGDNEKEELLNEDEEDESKLVSVNINALLLKRAEEKPGGLWVHRTAKIQEISFFEKDERTRVAITIDKFYKGPQKDRETEEWGLGLVNVVYTFPSLLRRTLLKGKGNIKRIQKAVMKDEELLNLFLIDCPITFAVEKVEEGEVYVNPISGREKDEPSEYETRYTHLMSIEQDAESKELVRQKIAAMFSK